MINFKFNLNSKFKSLSVQKATSKKLYNITYVVGSPI